MPLNPVAPTPHGDAEPLGGPILAAASGRRAHGAHRRVAAFALMAAIDSPYYKCKFTLLQV